MAKRIAKEAKDLGADAGLDWGSAEPIDDNLFHWNACILGPEGSPYEGGVFNLDLELPSSYPFKPPVVKFLTKVYHPSVKQDSGEICADLITEKWSPTLNIKWILQVIRSMLEAPTADSPLEPAIGTQLKNDPEAFAAEAAKQTSAYAT
jgi:ubiquitin-conjugating enzyme E2 D/E